MSGFAIGDSVYVFEADRRVYAPDKRGGPIFREKFILREIVGETSRSWLVGASRDKYAKKPPANATLSQRLLTLSDVDDACWFEANRYRICRAVERATCAQLRQIAEIISYQAPDTPERTA